MASLTSIFNFIYVYLRALVCYIFGGRFEAKWFVNHEQIEIAKNIVRNATYGAFENGITFNAKPVLVLVIGIFALGSIIGLVRRLMR